MQPEHTRPHKLTRLANEEADVIPEDGCVAIQEVAGHVHHHRQFCQLFKKLPSLTST